MTRTATIERTTKETSITCTINLDGSGKSTVNTGLGFFDHMLNAFAKHSRIDLELACAGDIHCDDHHTVEDCAIVIAEATSKAIDDARGIERFGQSFIPMDETLVRCAIDLCGRPTAVITLDLKREDIGGVAAENITHFFRSFANTLRCSLHLDTIRGDNDHHKAEAAFKSLARALQDAVALTTFNDIPSTKGVVR
jgi:imidazoleglycerol phosphate dehydratase HisB